MQTSPQSRIHALTNAGYWSDETLHDILAAQAAEVPERTALVDQPNKTELTGLPVRRVNFAELEALSDQLAGQLLALGLRHDDRILVQLPNIAELVITYFAASKLGVVISPLPIQYGGHELKGFADSLQPAAVITLGQFREQDLAARAQAALPELPVWRFGNELDLDRPATPEDIAMLRAHREQHPADANDILTVVWTSGTTGTPKGVPRSHNMWQAIARNTMAAGNYQQGETLLVPLPSGQYGGAGRVPVPRRHQRLSAGAAPAHGSTDVPAPDSGRTGQFHHCAARPAQPSRAAAGPVAAMRFQCDPRLRLGLGTTLSGHDPGHRGRVRQTDHQLLWLQ